MTDDMIRCEYDTRGCHIPATLRVLYKIHDFTLDLYVCKDHVGPARAKLPEAFDTEPLGRE